MTFVDTIRHGTRMGYRDDRCKCDDCRRAIAREHNVYWMRRAANGGQPLTVPKVGAVRRIQALMALGWPRRELAKRAGYAGDAFALLLNGQRQRITIETHQRIVALYEDLCMTLGPSNSSRIRAASAGFAVPLAWDDETIDDPTARPHGTHDTRSRHDLDPVVVERVLAGDRDQPVTRAERHEVIRRWPGSIGALERLRPDWNVARDLREMRAGMEAAS